MKIKEFFTIISPKVVFDWGIFLQSIRSHSASRHRQSLRPLSRHRHCVSKNNSYFLNKGNFNLILGFPDIKSLELQIIKEKVYTRERRIFDKDLSTEIDYLLSTSNIMAVEVGKFN